MLDKMRTLKLQKSDPKVDGERLLQLIPPSLHLSILVLQQPCERCSVRNKNRTSGYSESGCTHKDTKVVSSPGTYRVNLGGGTVKGRACLSLITTSEVPSSEALNPPTASAASRSDCVYTEQLPDVNV